MISLWFIDLKLDGLINQPTLVGCPTSCLKCATKFVFSGPVLSIDWLKGKSIGNHVYSHEILGGVRYPILSFYISSFIYIYIWPSKVPGKRVLLSKLPALLYLDFKPNHLYLAYFTLSCFTLFFNHILYYRKGAWH